MYLRYANDQGMTKRLLRLTDGTTIAKRAEALLGTKINIVFKNGSVSFVNLVDFKDSFLIVENMRQARQKISLASVAELIIDVEANA